MQPLPGMSLDIIMSDNVEVFLGTIERHAPGDEKMVVEDEEEEDSLSKPAPATVEEDEYAMEDRYSYITNRMSEVDDILGVVMYKAKSEDEWSPIVV